MPKQKIKWADAFTTETPPKPKKAKTNTECRHTRDEWDGKRQRIEELFLDENYTLSDVQRILAGEGFKSSQKQLKDRLDTWGDSKYLTFTEPQWRYIAYKALTRHAQNPGKNTAFRFKGAGEPLPAPRIERNLERKLEKAVFWDTLSLCQPAPSCGLSAFTSSTSNGIHISARAIEYAITTGLWGLIQGIVGLSHDTSRRLVDLTSPHFTRLSNRRRVIASAVFELQSRYHRDRFNYKEGKYPQRLRRPFPSVDIITCEDCPSYAYPIRFNVLDDTTHEFPPPGDDSTIREASLYGEICSPYLAQSGAEYDSIAAGQLILDHESGAWFIENQEDDAAQEFFTSKLYVHPEDIRKSIANFERYHLLDPYHQKRVQLRLLGNPPQWEGRSKFVQQTGLTCPHPHPPEVYQVWEQYCWSPGGCRWSQFKTVEENAMKAIILERMAAVEADRAAEEAFLGQFVEISTSDIPFGVELIPELEDGWSFCGTFGSNTIAEECSKEDITEWCPVNPDEKRDYVYDWLTRWNMATMDPGGQIVPEPEGSERSNSPSISLPSTIVDRWLATVDETVLRLEEIP